MERFLDHVDRAYGGPHGARHVDRRRRGDDRPAEHPAGRDLAHGAGMTVPRPTVRGAMGLPVVGMVGGGQLSRMTHQAAIALGLSLRVLADATHDSAALVAQGVQLGVARVAGGPAGVRARLRGGHLRPRARAERPARGARGRGRHDRPGQRRPAARAGQARHARAAVRARRPRAAVLPGGERRRRRGVRAARRLAAGAQGGDRRLRRQGRLGRGGRRRGGRGARERCAPGRRAARAAAARARRGRGPLARGAGRRVAGRRDRPVGRHLRRGGRAGARACPRSARSRRSGSPSAWPTRSRSSACWRSSCSRRPTGCWSTSWRCAPQQRPLDDRGRAHVAVRAAPAGGPRLADGRDDADRPVGRDGQPARRRRRGPAAGPAAAHAVRPRPRAEGPPVRQAGPAGPQDRPRHGARRRPRRRATARPGRRALPEDGRVAGPRRRDRHGQRLRLARDVGRGRGAAGVRRAARGARPVGAPHPARHARLVARPLPDGACASSSPVRAAPPTCPAWSRR